VVRWRKVCPWPTRRATSGVLLGAVLLAAAGTAASGAQPGTAASVRPGGAAAADTAYDVRQRRGRTAAPRASAAQRRLSARLGRSAIVAPDPLTGGLRLVARLNGFLTEPSGASPRRIALDYVRRQAAFGLDASDLAALELTRSYTSESGATHLWWQQAYTGIPAFDQGLRANVAADGRLINIGGSPRPDLEVASTEPRIGPREALGVVARDISAQVALGSAGAPRGPDRATEFDRGHRASLVLFTDATRVRLAWRALLLAGSRGVYDVVVDATSGELLYRNSLVHNATALVFDNYPGAPRGGTQQRREVPAAWLDGSGRLSGANAHVYSDEDNQYEESFSPGPYPPAAGKEITAGEYGQMTFSGGSCPPAGCTWDSTSPSSWITNRAQAGTQLFYYVNRFHDHLLSAPGIAFGPSSGNFEGADAVRAQVDEGANGGCADTNNAGIIVRPDPQPAAMEMYLWTGACEAGVHDVNGADDAFLVYHEYTHGLSSRLVTDAAGFGALNGPQSGAMGEGISDWYALDFLEGAGFEVDTPAPAELRTGVYENSKVRSQGFDCPVGDPTGACPGAGTAGSGGYTYGDFGKISPTGRDEIHADGEIWVETLGDLRRALVGAHGTLEGINRGRALVTDGMRLSPDNPTFLDMRNAILQADVNRGFRECDRIWAVFAARGMGANARTFGDNDTAPIEDFSAPPPACQAPPPPPPPDTTAPVVRGFSMSRKRFRVGPDRTPRVAQRRRRRRAPEGSAFRFSLSEAARVVITIERALPGRAVGRRCRPPSRRLRGRRRCTRYAVRGSLTRRNRPVGRNIVPFSGRVGIKALRPGLHRATISATDVAGNRSQPRRASFTVVRH
jgi:extracellular elastinolytic metalloproteinase